MPKNIITYSDLRANNKVFRLQQTIESRLNYFKGQAHYQIENFSYSPEKVQRVTEVINKLERLHSRAKVLDLVIDTNKTVGKEKNGNRKTLKRNKITNGKDTLAQMRNNAHSKDNEYLKIYREIAKWPKKKEHFETELFLIEQGCFEEDEITAHLLKSMSDSAREACVKRIEDRLFIQLTEAVDKNWYITFSTLTVNAEHYDTVFERGSDAWRNYIRSVERYVAKTCYGSYREAKRAEEEYFNFFAVVEEGAENDRLHIHVLMFMNSKRHEKYRYDLWPDPNAYIAASNRREIDDLKKYWQYGLSQHIAVRINSRDIWGQNGWKWPKLNGEPIEGTDVIKLTRYMLKYLLKAERIELKGEIKSWKIRTNHLMGKRTLQSLLTKMEINSLLALTYYKIYPNQIQCYGRKIQTKIIRSLAMKELLSRLKNESEINQLLCNKSTALKQLLTNMTGKRQNRNWQNIGNLLQELYSNGATSSQYLEEFLKAKSIIENYMPEKDGSSRAYSNYIR